MTMPSEAKYRELLNGLRLDGKAFRAAGTEDDDARRDRLKAALSSLERMVLYFVSDPEIRDHQLLNPVGFLVSTLHNKERGAAPPQFDLRPDGAGDKPTGTMRELAQGGIAFAVEALRSVKQRDPSQWVAAALRAEGVRAEDGGAITSDQIKGWRYDIRREKAPAAAREQFEALRQQFAAIRVANPSDVPERAREFARSIVLSLVHLGKVAPRRRRTA